MGTAEPRSTAVVPEAIGHYRILRKLGEGGMGVVYAAHDERLDRSVAIKTIRDPDATPQSRERIWREARAAASVSHPNVCQLYDVGEHSGALFIAMELLEGEPLAARIARGPLAPAEAAQVTLAMLSALDALHQRGIVHRDLKPSNVYLTPHGVKLLDFGLARPLATTENDLTLPGTVLGTPRYMAPEQWVGGPIDARADLFTVGALLHEMLRGRPAFEGKNLLEVSRAVASENPPALTGSDVIVAIDQVIHRALEKKAAARYPTAEAMAKDLREALLLVDSNQQVAARALQRLIVLPFRVLRPDPDTDFLAFSLPDAITQSLSGIDTLVVRSSLAAARFAGDALDLKKLASEAEVDVVLSGTLLRAGEQLRVSAQLAEAPAGTLLWSKTSQVSMGDIFHLQDSLARQIVESLALPLGTATRIGVARDIPTDPRAYELYLRGNALSARPNTFFEALAALNRCLEIDPHFAPAWARVGRLHRVIAKFDLEDVDDHVQRAEEAFRKALEINPDLSMAHNLYAQHEVDVGRAPQAMVRLLQRASARQGDPELYAGLVHACRYCDLLEASVAAFERARRLDSMVRTSVSWSYYVLGDYQRAMETDHEEFRFVRVLALMEQGQHAEARAIANALDWESMTGTMKLFTRVTRGLLESDSEMTLGALDQLDASRFRDGEGLYFIARSFAREGEIERALATLRRVVDNGFLCFRMMARDSWLDPLRVESEFVRILRDAETHAREAAHAYVEAGGERVLGVRPR
jgi:non-specific serine/threonine protein kinase